VDRNNGNKIEKGAILSHNASVDFIVDVAERAEVHAVCDGGEDEELFGSTGAAFMCTAGNFSYSNLIYLMIGR
jgi:hypothetical protein